MKVGCIVVSNKCSWEAKSDGVRGARHANVREEHSRQRESKCKGTSNREGLEILNT